MTTANVAAASGDEDVINTEYLGMSDEDFLKINAPGAPAPVATNVEEGADNTAPSGVAQPDETTPAEPGTEPGADDVSKPKDTNDNDLPVAADDTKPAGVAADPAVVAGADQAKPAAAKADAKTPAGADDKAEPAAKTPGAKAEDAKAEEKPVDLQGFYNSLIGVPIKANGKSIVLNTPDEVLRMVQMGAGYGRKIQDLQPHLKTIRMLEKHDMLDESKLSYAIDIINKNPDAIKKLIKDSGIDPLDLNIEDNVSYKQVNHAVSDQEMTFQDALQEVQAQPQGTETLRVINQTWDQQSKSALWSDPKIMTAINAQRENGIYDQIVAEIDRQKLLGTIPHSAPFIHAYQQVGDYMQANKAFKVPVEQTEQIQKQPGDTPQTQVIATRSAAPKAQVKNGDQAAAASPTKTATTRKASTTINPLAMADEDFLKQFSGRL